MPDPIVRAAIVFLVWSCLSAGSTAQEHQPLPVPQPLAAPAPPVTYVIPYPVVPPRVDTRNVWSLFAPDQTGKLRPRVVLSPYGSYYQYSGEPFPWTTTQPRLILPKTGG